MKTKNNEEISVKIDGKEIEVEKETTILEAAEESGIDIPTLCHHSALPTYGSCRLCSVEITDERGRNKIVTSCNYPIREEIEIDTKSEKVIETRKMLIELLLARCPTVEKIQELAEEYDIGEPRLQVDDETETCILCGLCTRVCGDLVNLSAINFENRGVEREVDSPYHTFSEDCIGCGACALVCPTPAIERKRNIYPTLEENEEKIEEMFLKGEKDEELGVYNDLFSAKGSFKGQDGGMVTSMLISGLENDLFDAAVVVGGDEYSKSEAILVDSPEEIKKASETKYLRFDVAKKLEEAVEKGKKKIAVVATPCKVRESRKIQQVWMNESVDVDLFVIGLFCFESFDYKKLKQSVKEKLGIDLDDAEKTQISSGKFIVGVDGEEYSCKVSELDEAIEHGCVYCNDFVSRLADISVGSVGSSEGYSTVVVRSEKGKELLQENDYDRVSVNQDQIRRLVKFKGKRARKRLSPLDYLP